MEGIRFFIWMKRTKDERKNEKFKRIEEKETEEAYDDLPFVEMCKHDEK